MNINPISLSGYSAIQKPTTPTLPQKTETALKAPVDLPNDNDSDDVKNPPPAPNKVGAKLDIVG